MSTPSSGRAQRVDARANRGRILDVAEEVFGRGGESASTEEVARLAGVGIGTVFRHFPTKAALLEAVLAREFARLQEEADALLDADDPGEAFLGFFGHLVARSPAKIAIAGALFEAGGDRDGIAGQASGRLRVTVGTLLDRARQAGAVRPDIGLTEVYALLAGLSQAVARARLDERELCRLLAVVRDGLSAGTVAGAGSTSAESATGSRL